jgi:RNA polymerase sigma-70 factor (ECF subfamily)
VLTLRGRAKGRLDAADFELLYQRHGRELLAFLARRTYDPEVAVDLLGETFAVAFRDRRQFHGEDLDAARAWLFGVARHRLALYFRRGRVERRALARLRVERRALTPSEYDRIEELAASRALREALSEQFEGLGSEQRDVLRLRVVEGRSYAEVAAELGISEENARARASRALRVLRDAPGLRDLKEAMENV